MDFTKKVEENLQLFVDNTKLFKQMVDALDEYDDNNEMKKLLEESVKKRLQQGEEMIKQEQEQKDALKAIDQAMGESSTPEELSRNVEKLMLAAAKKSFKVKNTIKYKCFKKEIESAAGAAGGNAAGAAGGNAPAPDDDCNIEVVETGGDVVSLHDPWTMALMKEPVRNKMCGHIYDKGSVNAMIKDNLSVLCPVSGCANEHYIQPSHLVKDLETLKKLRLSEQNQEVHSDSDESD